MTDDWSGEEIARYIQYQRSESPGEGVYTEEEKDLTYCSSSANSSYTPLANS